MAIIGNQILSTNYLSDQFSGDSSTVAFTLSLAPASAASISVYVSGLYQIPGSAYTVSGSTLTFTGAPPTGTNNIYVLYLGVKNQNLVPVNGSITPQMLNNANVIYWSTSNNNVGIGNTTPSHALSVAGSGNFTGSVNVATTFAAGNTTITGFNNSTTANVSSMLIVGTYGVPTTGTGFRTTSGDIYGQVNAVDTVHIGVSSNSWITSGNLGINTMTPKTLLHVGSSNSSDTPTSGSATGALVVSNLNGNYGLQMGVQSTGASWIQSTRVDGTATNYNLMLNPIGGNVLIGTNALPSYVATYATVSSGGTGTSDTHQVAVVGNNGAAAELLISGGNSATNRRAGIRFWSQQYSNTGPTWSIGTSFGQTAGDGNFYWYNAANNPAFTISQNNYFGIATSNPTTSLDVNPGSVTYAYNGATRLSRNASGAGQNVLVVEQAGASSSEDFTLNAQSTSYTTSSTPGWGQFRMMCNRSQSSVWNFLTACSSGGNDVEFYLRGDGQAYADGSWNGGGADYAEYFESSDGSAIEIGMAVVLEQGKVRLATSNDNPSNILGVVRPRGTSATIGNTAQAKWAKKYLTDDYGAPLTEPFTEVRWKPAPDAAYISYILEDIDSSIIPDGAEYRTVDDDGVPLIRRVLNPEYDPDATYVPRETRPEWNVIGLLGQVPVKKGSPTGSNWIKMWDVSDAVEMWMIR